MRWIKLIKIQHVVFKHLFREVLNGFDTWEEKVVHYSDKRCREDEIVTLKQRFADSRKRYADRVNETTAKAEQKIIELEKEIFNILELDPEKLKEYL